jgi:CRP/FNR family cyclic AMP-dependent transcriptional regulator
VRISALQDLQHDSVCGTLGRKIAVSHLSCLMIIQSEKINMVQHNGFDMADFLATSGVGRRIVQFKPKEALFTQGKRADSIFYLQRGRAKLAAVSSTGKEATIALLSGGDFVGEEALANPAKVHIATAIAINNCTALRIERQEMLRVMHEEHSFSDMFLEFLLTRGMRTKADLIDQLFNSSEKRLARTLLLMAEFAQPGEPKPLIPPITQETLADMIGTTRARVNFFMNRFRKLGYIEYHGRIRVHRSLLNAVLHDHFPEHRHKKVGASKPDITQPRPPVPFCGQSFPRRFEASAPSSDG